MNRASAGLWICIAMLVAACDDTGGGYPLPDGDVSTDQPPTDTTGDAGGDTAVDAPADTAVDPPVEAIPDTPPDTHVDPGADGDLTDIEKFCTTACIDCFSGLAGWNHLPADQCIPECVADFDDCAPGDIPGILTCTGGEGCPEGALGFGFCIEPYTCMLN